jgi:hypothetical protein
MHAWSRVAIAISAINCLGANAQTEPQSGSGSYSPQRPATAVPAEKLRYPGTPPGAGHSAGGVAESESAGSSSSHSSPNSGRPLYRDNITETRDSAAAIDWALKNQRDTGTRLNDAKPGQSK